jgi:hypothetical protein
MLQPRLKPKSCHFFCVQIEIELLGAKHWRLKENPDCHRNAELDVNGLPDNVTLVICNRGCSAQCAIIAAPTLGRHGCCRCSSGLSGLRATSRLH